MGITMSKDLFDIIKEIVETDNLYTYCKKRSGIK